MPAMLVLATHPTPRGHLLEHAKPIAEGAVDLGFRAAYRVAHRLLRAYWSFRRPSTWGALVAVWHEDELLLVKNSYRTHYTLPGGYIRPGESPEQAGARELREECDLEVAPDRIRQVYDATKLFEHRNDRVTIVEVTVPHRPVIEVDNREVVWAGFKPKTEVLALPIVPHLREYLTNR